MRSEYLPALRRLLSVPLARAESSGEPAAVINEVLGVMEDYGISREQFDFVMDVTNFKVWMCGCERERGRRITVIPNLEV